MSYASWNGIGSQTTYPLVTVNTITTATVGNSTTTILTTPTVLPAGTYLVGANMYVQSSTVFTGTDAIYFRIFDTAAVSNGYPQTLVTGYSATGNSPALLMVNVVGLIVLATAGTISWGTNCAFTAATGKTGGVQNAFYERVGQ